ncbi:putative Spindle pole protein [Giardia muris]|uniref:Putative Spindle pole protein n=1 Tax=Giardia muris TaxID=5742 RepID=A0A4Z1T4Y3_GIAMU|nr:putative Spindle pole protein [Giardia muris]|eukprot:TNJ29063.1 putative Spindle pole protein [Giardia muris]
MDENIVIDRLPDPLPDSILVPAVGPAHERHEKPVPIALLSADTRLNKRSHKKMRLLEERLCNDISGAIGKVLDQVRMSIAARKLYILFEPTLNCNPATDHLVPKDVLPIFEPFLNLAQDTLYTRIYVIVQQAVSELFKASQLKAPVDDNRMEILECRVVELRRQLESMEREFDKSASRFALEKANMSAEITQLREQLWQKEKYTAEYEADFNPYISPSKWGLLAFMVGGTSGLEERKAVLTQLLEEEKGKCAELRMRVAQLEIDYFTKVSQANLVPELQKEINSLRKTIEEYQQQLDSSDMIRGRNFESLKKHDEALQEELIRLQTKLQQSQEQARDSQEVIDDLTRRLSDKDIQNERLMNSLKRPTLSSPKQESVLSLDDVLNKARQIIESPPITDTTTPSTERDQRRSRLRDWKPSLDGKGEELEEAKSAEGRKRRKTRGRQRSGKNDSDGESDDDEAIESGHSRKRRTVRETGGPESQERERNRTQRDTTTPEHRRSRKRKSRPKGDGNGEVGSSDSNTSSNEDELSYEELLRRVKELTKKNRSLIVEKDSMAREMKKIKMKASKTVAESRGSERDTRNSMDETLTLSSLETRESVSRHEEQDQKGRRLTDRRESQSLKEQATSISREEMGARESKEKAPHKRKKVIRKRVRALLLTPQCFMRFKREVDRDSTLLARLKYKSIDARRVTPEDVSHIIQNVSGEIELLSQIEFLKSTDFRILEDAISQAEALLNQRFRDEISMDGTCSDYTWLSEARPDSREHDFDGISSGSFCGHRDSSNRSPEGSGQTSHFTNKQLRDILRSAFELELPADLIESLTVDEIAFQLLTFRDFVGIRKSNLSEPEVLGLFGMEEDRKKKIRKIVGQLLMNNAGIHNGLSEGGLHLIVGSPSNLLGPQKSSHPANEALNGDTLAGLDDRIDEDITPRADRQVNVFRENMSRSRSGLDSSTDDEMRRSMSPFLEQPRIYQDGNLRISGTCIDDDAIASNDPGKRGPSDGFAAHLSQDHSRRPSGSQASTLSHEQGSFIMGRTMDKQADDASSRSISSVGSERQESRRSSKALTSNQTIIDVVTEPLRESVENILKRLGLGITSNGADQWLDTTSMPLGPDVELCVSSTGLASVNCPNGDRIYKSGLKDVCLPIIDLISIAPEEQKSITFRIADFFQKEVVPATVWDEKRRRTPRKVNRTPSSPVQNKSSRVAADKELDLQLDVLEDGGLEPVMSSGFGTLSVRRYRGDDLANFDRFMHKIRKKAKRDMPEALHDISMVLDMLGYDMQQLRISVVDAPEKPRRSKTSARGSTFSIKHLEDKIAQLHETPVTVKQLSEQVKALSTEEKITVFLDALASYQVTWDDLEAVFSKTELIERLKSAYSPRRNSSTFIENDDCIHELTEGIIQTHLRSPNGLVSKDVVNEKALGKWINARVEIAAPYVRSFENSSNTEPEVSLPNKPKVDSGTTGLEENPLTHSLDDLLHTYEESAKLPDLFAPEEWAELASRVPTETLEFIRQRLVIEQEKLDEIAELKEQLAVLQEAERAAREHFSLSLSQGTQCGTMCIRDEGVEVDVASAIQQPVVSVEADPTPISTDHYKGNMYSSPVRDVIVPKGKALYEEINRPIEVAEDPAFQAVSTIVCASKREEREVQYLPIMGLAGHKVGELPPQQKFPKRPQNVKEISLRLGFYPREHRAINFRYVGGQRLGARVPNVQSDAPLSLIHVPVDGRFQEGLKHASAAASAVLMRHPTIWKHKLNWSVDDDPREVFQRLYENARTIRQNLEARIRAKQRLEAILFARFKQTYICLSQPSIINESVAHPPVPQISRSLLSVAEEDEKRDISGIYGHNHQAGTPSHTYLDASMMSWVNSSGVDRSAQPPIDPSLLLSGGPRRGRERSNIMLRIQATPLRPLTELHEEFTPEFERYNKQAHIRSTPSAPLRLGPEGRWAKSRIAPPPPSQQDFQVRGVRVPEPQVHNYDSNARGHLSVVAKISSAIGDTIDQLQGKPGDVPQPLRPLASETNEPVVAKMSLTELDIKILTESQPGSTRESIEVHTPLNKQRDRAALFREVDQRVERSNHRAE